MNEREEHELGGAETRPEAQEGFGEATPGEAQSSDPPADPEMIEDEESEDTPPSEPNQGAWGPDEAKRD